MRISSVMCNAALALAAAVLVAVAMPAGPASAGSADIRSAGCKGHFVRYQLASVPRAFALSADGRYCGYVLSNEERCPDGNMECLRTMATGFCSEYGGQGCGILDTQTGGPIAQSFGLAAAGDIASRFCKGQYAEFEAMSGPRAMALSANREACGLASTSTCASGEESCLRTAAINFCEEYGDGCTVYQFRTQ